MRFIIYIQKVLLPALAIGLASASCIFDYPDSDCIESGNVRIDFDWSLSPDSHPEGMGVFLYSTADESYWRFDLRPSGGFITARNSHYNILTYNNDSESTIFVNNGDYHTIAATTRTAQLADGFSSETAIAQPPRGKSSGQLIMEEPDMVWTDAFPNRTIESTDAITFKPQKVVAVYKILVDGIENLASASQFSCSLSGLSAAYSLGDKTKMDFTATIPAKLTQTDAQSISGTLHTFGTSPSATENWLAVYFWLRDGQKVMFQFDVTSQIHNTPNPMEVYINLSGIKLPPVESKPEGGMDVGVDNWEIIDIELSNRS